MKFQAAQRSVIGSKMIDSLDQESVETEITHARWLVPFTALALAIVYLSRRRLMAAVRP
jgi:hypothetical protein